MVRTDTVLISLACGIALLGFVSLFPYLEPIPRLLFPAALAAGIWIERKNLPVHSWIATAVSLLFFIFYGAQFTRDNLVGPAVNLLVVLLAVRLFSGKNARNYLQIYALSLFALAGSSLFSLSALFLCYFFAMLTLIAVSLVVLTFHSSSSARAVSRAGMKRLLSAALVLPAASLPLILLFFFILPRTQYPLWNFLSAGGARVTGFSDKVAPGSAPAVGEVRSAAFRVNCERLPRERLYWRGIVLNTFDGRAWLRREPPGAENGLAREGKTVRQVIFPEPGRSPYLMGLNMPRQIAGIRFSAASDGTFVKGGAREGHEKYEVVSVLAEVTSVARGIDAEFYRALPPSLPPRMVSLGAAIARKGGSDAERLELLEEYFRAAGLSYATSGLPVGEEPLAQFLFDSRRGNCEFFASSFALLLRIAGVPARLVGGYYGGEFNELGGYYLITEDMAHVWVEAFIAGKGWLTVDPSRWAVNSSVVGAAGKRGAARTISMMVDVLGYYWNLAVINYDLDRQLHLISTANSELKRLAVPAHLKRSLLWGLVLVLVAGLALCLSRRGRSVPEERILRFFLKRVRREYGIEPGPATGLHELAAILDDPAAGRFAEIYGNAVYRDRRLTPGEIGELKGLARGLRNPARSGASAPFHKP